MTNPSRPSAFEDRYRLYLDESGDHVYRATNEAAHRFLGLLGCWFNNVDYLQFHEALEDLKRRHFHHHPDNPVILHREDMINRRKVFKILQDDPRRAEFDADLLSVIQTANFRIVVVVIDKAAMRTAYGKAPAIPITLGWAFSCNALQVTSIISIGLAT
ncbi:MAG: DUF3800 domain-containing protein [Chloroflexota bacterium]